MTSRSEAGPGSSWNLKANLSFLGTVMHYEGLSGTLGASRGVDWCSRSLRELEDTQLSVLSAWSKDILCVPSKTRNPTAPHLRALNIGAQQFIV